MAKAFEWAAKFVKVNTVEDWAAILKEYEEETKSLIDLRTKNSKDQYRAAAIDGAIREQRQKFLSICKSAPYINVEMFDKLVNSYKVAPKELVSV